MKVKTTMVISGARFIFYDLLNHYQFSDEDKNRIIKCAADLANCVKESDENVTQTDLCNIDDMKAEINRLREALKEIARDKTTEEQQGNPDYVDEDGDLIGDFEYAYDEFIKIARKALNGESEGDNG